MDRFLAATTVAVVFVVIRTANRPLDLWVLNGSRSTFVALVYAAAATAVIFLPRSRPATILLGAIGTAFWGLRALDLLLASIDGDANLWTAAAIHVLLATTIATYYARSVKRLAFFAAVDADRPLADA